MASPSQNISSLFPSGSNFKVPAYPTTRSAEDVAQFVENAWGFQTSCRTVRVVLSPRLRCTWRIARAFIGSILNITYGTESESAIESYTSVAEETARGFAVAGNPGGFMVDLFPVREFTLTWFLANTVKLVNRHTVKIAVWVCLSRGYSNLKYKRIFDFLIDKKWI